MAGFFSEFMNPAGSQQAIQMAQDDLELRRLTAISQNPGSFGAALAGSNLGKVLSGQGGFNNQIMDNHPEMIMQGAFNDVLSQGFTSETQEGFGQALMNSLQNRNAPAQMLFAAEAKLQEVADEGTKRRAEVAKADKFQKDRNAAFRKQTKSDLAEFVTSKKATRRAITNLSTGSAQSIAAAMFNWARAVTGPGIITETEIVNTVGQSYGGQLAAKVRNLLDGNSAQLSDQEKANLRNAVIRLNAENARIAKDIVEDRREFAEIQGVDFEAAVPLSLRDIDSTEFDQFMVDSSSLLGPDADLTEERIGQAAEKMAGIVSPIIGQIPGVAGTLLEAVIGGGNGQAVDKAAGVTINDVLLDPATTPENISDQNLLTPRLTPEEARAIRQNEGRPAMDAAQAAREKQRAMEKELLKTKDGRALLLKLRRKALNQ